MGRVAGKPTIPLQYDEGVANRIEEKLEEAQTLAASLDEEKAIGLLTEIEGDLLAHPELPQAAWLMAERHQSLAAIRKRQPDGANEADRLLSSARALEGPRAASFGDTPSTVKEPSTRALLHVRDLAAADTLVLDGNEAPSSTNVLPGRHHALVRRGARLAWVGWFDVLPGARADVTLGVPPRIPCSLDDLADVEVGTRTPTVLEGVRCARWIGVRRGTTGLEVAWCEGSRCTAYGPLLADQNPVARPATLPPWLAATIVGAATVGAASLLLATGAFDREQPAPVHVVTYSGPP